MQRNSTSYPAKATSRLQQLHEEYRRALADPDDPEHAWASLLKYYQYLIRAVMANPEYGVGLDGNARGLLVYMTMGMGKTRAGAAVAVTAALHASRPVVIMLARGLQKNFRSTLELVVRATAPHLSMAEAMKRFSFVSMDAYNSASQLGGAAMTGLDGKLLIVDEAHNFFRSIINSAAEASNARKMYDMIMAARNLRLLFLTGEPAAKDPFELVPCFNMLAGRDLLPTQYEIFYKLYVDRENHTVRNRAKLANRLAGLVSHVTHSRPNEVGADVIAKAPGDEGWFPVELPTILESVEMGVDQYRRYLLAREKEEAEGKGSSGPSGRASGVLSGPPLALPGSEKKAMSSYYVRSRSYENFAPPRDFLDTPVARMPDEAFTPECSPKLALIADRALMSPGPVLVYSQFVDTGGLNPLGRYLQLRGFRPFDPAKWLAAAAETDAAVTVGGRMKPAKQHSTPFRPIKAEECRKAAERVLATVDHTPEEKEFIEKLVTHTLPAPSPWYDPAHVPHTKYRPTVTARWMMPGKLMNLHHGQRKLFEGEIYALMHFLPRADSKAVVVYAGSAPGYHIDLLADLFPGIEWHLYDPRDFVSDIQQFQAPKFEPAAFEAEYGPTGLTGQRYHVHNDYFTDEVAAAWAGKCDVFISDIRISDASFTAAQFEAQVRIDMEAQDRWARLIRARVGTSLKFRPPYDASVTLSYLRGRVLIQTWPSFASGEGRLLSTPADVAAPPMDLKVAHYEDCCAERNMVLRPWATYEPPAPGLEHVPGYDRCYDCTAEAASWVRYLAMPGAARHPSGSPYTVSALMNRLTRATQQRLNIGETNPPPYHGYLAHLPAALRVEAAYQLKSRHRGRGEIEEDSEEDTMSDGANVSASDGANAAILSQVDDFPYRRAYMPPFAEMYARLVAYAARPPTPGVKGYLEIVQRSFPEEYEATDSLSDWFSEEARVLCNERGERSPWAVWQSLKEDGRLPAGASPRVLRDLVYNGARGCNLFNGALAVALFRGARRILDCTAGWGDRLIAAHVVGAEFYRGWDTNPDLQGPYKEIAAACAAAGAAPLDWRVECAPFETAQVVGLYDTVIVAPPYYDKELYTGDSTSTTAYRNVNDWYQRFYNVMIRKAAAALAPGGRLLLNIPAGRMLNEARTVLRGKDITYKGALGYQQVVGGVAPRIFRETFIFQRAFSTGGAKKAKGKGKSDEPTFTELAQYMVNAIADELNVGWIRNSDDLWVRNAFAIAKKEGLLVSFMSPREDYSAATFQISPDMSIWPRPGGVMWLSNPDLGNGSWYYFARTAGLHWADPGKNAIIGYKIDVSRLLHIDTPEALMQFNKKYGVCPKGLPAGLCELNCFIDWARVAADHPCGIAFSPYFVRPVDGLASMPEEGVPLYVWYCSLDAASYAIWDLSVVGAHRVLYEPPATAKEGGDGVIDDDAPTYAIISGEVSNADRELIRDVSNSPANKHGEIIKAILVSKTGAEGLDLKWIRSTHQVEAYWDMARNNQVKSRAVRLGSHDGLPREERVVQPYLYIARANQEVWTQIPETGRELQTIDEQFHARALDKYRTNAAFRQMLSEVCLECGLFRYGNCRLCVPTDAPLFHDDPSTDARLPDPCRVAVESEVAARPLEFGGETYYYVADPASIFGVTFYVNRADLGGYAPLDPALPVVQDLLRLVEGRP